MIKLPTSTIFTPSTYISRSAPPGTPRIPEFYINIPRLYRDYRKVDLPKVNITWNLALGIELWSRNSHPTSSTIIPRPHFVTILKSSGFHTTVVEGAVPAPVMVKLL